MPVATPGDSIPQDSAPTSPAATGGKTKRTWGVFRRRDKGGLYVYQHSNLLYWWVVWLYGFFCAALTYVQGIGIPQLAASERKVVLFHPSPWLGASFIALVLFVVVFTNVRARGVYSLVLLLVAAVLVYGASRMPGIEIAMGWVSLIRLHLNLAFYLTFSTLLLLIWLFVIVFIDHFTWWRFSPGQVIEEHRVGHTMGHAYNTEGMVLRRLPDDFFRHRVLGFGTGDFMVKPANEDAFEIQNVWKANAKQPEMEQAVATRITEEAKRRSG
jgi:hypothetical protein